MFVPRAVRLKGVKEIQRPKIAKPLARPQLSKDEANNKDALVEAMGETSMSSPAPQQDTASDAAAPARGPRFTTKPVTPEYIAQLAAGIELIFTDYAHQEEERSRWLKDRYREIDGKESYIHLTAILEHTNISKLKPEATQILLKQALHDHPSAILELSQNEYHVRRRPCTNPLPFVPHNSFEIVDDDGLSFWDQRTIYVEPHLRNISPMPAKVAQWLAEHGQLKPKWLPIQAVHTLWNSCALVVLSGNVMHDGTWNKWREAGKPEGWKVMTKVEHTKRTAEYVALLEQENPRGMRKITQDTSQLPPIARPATLPVAFEPLPEEACIKVEGKKKRKRRKPAKPGGHAGHDGGETGHALNQHSADMPDARPADAPKDVDQEGAAPCNKKKRKRRKPGSHIETDDPIAAAGADDAPSKKRRR
ncbi:uncharacterized protein EKO05_0006211 [Ascochyta rabiei]|uniref:Uncharacterized protein n=1 Tax=Didymella rabiei TaxID=5454 RepID=A0A163AV60_DIDRA|nr:uncharacterized protein EKO05_0006211 [Ascochyta rabiei]KZM21412.1 hypothetical protein ST47_g7416 [Ascochyta rabiei]UPX15772.1 hypothetical protein EKO05_0006211 [Ascochyta rabiei]